MNLFPSALKRGAIAVVTASALVLGSYNAPAAAQDPIPTNPLCPNLDNPTFVECLINLIEVNFEGGRIALYRTYLPMTGRRGVALPLVFKQKTEDGEFIELPPCPQVALIGGNPVLEAGLDASAVEELYARGEDNMPEILAAWARYAGITDEYLGRPEVIRRGFPFCAWWMWVDERFFNIVFPDATATYWVTPWIAPTRVRELFPNQISTNVILRGKFINARYLSFTVYNIVGAAYQWKLSSTVSLSSEARDYQLNPVNPDFDKMTGLNPFRTPLPVRANGTVCDDTNDLDDDNDPCGIWEVHVVPNPTAELQQANPQITYLPQYCNTSIAGARCLNVAPENNDFGIEPVNPFSPFSQGTFNPIKAFPLPQPCNTIFGIFPCPTRGMTLNPMAIVQGTNFTNPSNNYAIAGADYSFPILDFLVRPRQLMIARGVLPRTTGTAKEPNVDAKCARGIQDGRCYCLRNPDSCLPVPWQDYSPTSSGDAPCPAAPGSNVNPPKCDGPQATNLDMRYWSLCTVVMVRTWPTIGNIIDRFRENTGCINGGDVLRTNEKGARDSNGQYFTLVISPEDAKPEIFKAGTRTLAGGRSVQFGAGSTQQFSPYLGINWIEGTARTRFMWNWRNMMPNRLPSQVNSGGPFNFASNQAPKDGRWDSLKAVTQQYYPTVTTNCTKDRFDKCGWGYCVAGNPSFANDGSARTLSDTCGCVPADQSACDQKIIDCCGTSPTGGPPSSCPMPTQTCPYLQNGEFNAALIPDCLCTGLPDCVNTQVAFGNPEFGDECAGIVSAVSPKTNAELLEAPLPPPTPPAP